MAEGDDKIVSIKEARRGFFTIRGSGYCRHRETIVDPDKRLVTCKQCGTVMDPFDVLLRLSRMEREWTRNAKRLKGEAAKAAVKLKELRRQERNVRARLKRLKKKEED